MMVAMGDPYRDPSARFIKTHGVCILRDEVVAVAYYVGRNSSSLKVFIRSGQTISVEWDGLDTSFQAHAEIVKALEAP